MQGQNYSIKKSTRHRKIRRVLIIEGIANSVIMFVKAVVGINTGSSAIISDALHSLSDVFNNIIAVTLLNISYQHPDKKHPYGHLKFETLAVFVLATLLSVIAIEIALRAISRIGEPIGLSKWGLYMMTGVLLVNVVITTWERMWAKRLQSELLMADMRHTFSDVLTTIAVIGGWQLSARGYPMLDFILSIAISLFVLYLAYKLFCKSIPILVDSTSLNQEEVSELVGKIDGVIAVKRLRSRMIGKANYADIVISVDRNLNTEKAHKIADIVEKTMMSKFDIEDVVIHVEPD